jgi:hypothetical protein
MKLILISLLIKEALGRLAFKFDSINDGSSIPELGKGPKGISDLNGEDYHATWRYGLVVTDGVSSSRYPSSDLAEILALGVAGFLSSLRKADQMKSPEEYKKIVLRGVIDSLNDYQFSLCHSLFKNEKFKGLVIGDDIKNDLLNNLSSSSTLISAQIVDKDKNASILRVFQKGDSRLAIFRKTPNKSKEGYYYKLHLILEEQQHHFNCPFQFQNLRSYLNVINQEVFDLEILEDDIVLAASDGLFDNMFIGYLTYFVNFLISLFFEDNDLSEEFTKSQIADQINEYMNYLRINYEDFIKMTNAKEKVNPDTKKEPSFLTKASLYIENYKHIMPNQDVSDVVELLKLKTFKTKEEKEVISKAVSIINSKDELKRYEILTITKNLEKDTKTESNLKEDYLEKKPIKESKLKSELKFKKFTAKMEEKNNLIHFSDSQHYFIKPTDLNKIYKVPLSSFISSQSNNEIDHSIEEIFSFTQENIKFLMETINPKAFSQVIAETVKNLFQVGDGISENKEKALNPFSVEEYKINRNELSWTNMKLDDITVVTGFVVVEDEDSKKPNTMKQVKDEIKKFLKGSYERLDAHVSEFVINRVQIQVI